MKTHLKSALTAALLLGAGVVGADPLGTAFTYQGKLADGANPANGRYDLQFKLYDAAAAGNALGVPLTTNAVAVSNGLFTVTLDFGGGVFTGDARWLDIAVKTNGAGSYTPLTPRQPLTPSPYALYAPAAGTAGTATTATSATLANRVANNAVTAPGIAPGQVVKSLNALKDDVTLAAGANLTLTPSGQTLTLSTPADWHLGGNVGTTAGTHFLGTTDNQPLELKVNGQRGLRLETGTSNSVNVIGGWIGNSVAAGVAGATVAGGGAGNYDGDSHTNSVAADFGAIGGGVINTIQTNADYATIGGGASNTIQTEGGTIGGGKGNKIQPDASFSSIGGGVINTIAANAENATIAGGMDNNISTNADYGAIGGGRGNTIAAGSWAATIAGGYDNIGAASYSAIGGGTRNNIDAASNGAIGGGRDNNIAANAESATIAGGDRNLIRTNSGWGMIGGGWHNTIGNYSKYATIAGGWQNMIMTNSGWGMIGGGSQNYIADNSETATIAGGGANIIGMRSYGDRYGGFSDSSTIGGGWWNVIAGYSDYATISGGWHNQIGTNSEASTIGGGSGNIIASNSPYATIPGGLQNAATNYAFAAGRRARADHTGAFVWADSTDAVFASDGPNQFLVRANGGAQFQGPGNWDLATTEGDLRIGNDSYRLKIGVAYSGAGAGNVWMRPYGGTGKLYLWTPGGTTVYSDTSKGSGVSLAAGGGSWTSVSDRNAKENLSPVNAQAVLDKVAALPLATWNYKSQDAAVRHIGPMAQDFKAAFAVGESDTGITTIDADGVALAAIQGLNEVVKEKDARIAALEKNMTELKALVNTLAAKVNGGGQ